VKMQMSKFSHGDRSILVPQRLLLQAKQKRKS
jgi:hypothetical protein